MGFLMLFSIAYSIISPLIVGQIEELVVGDFPLNTLFLYVAAYAAILLISMACSYFQAIILQKTGQKIISTMREELFSHIEALSHEQLNEIPVGKLVTRTTNDTNAISLMFTNLLVNLLKNFFVIFGILAAMLASERGADADGALLCALHHSVFRDFPEIHEKGLPEGKGLHDETSTPTFPRTSPGIKITQIFNREDVKRRVHREKQCPRPCKTGADFRFWYLPAAGVYALHQFRALSPLFRRKRLY
ncbi:MAG: ABC transporter transmembrane domain-containing protein [Lachnospiraceae bacterium]